MGAVFALGASAQFEYNVRPGEWQLDSMYTVDKETGQRMVTEVFEYNGDGTLAVLYSTSQDYDYFWGMYVSERTKTVLTYNNGRLEKSEGFFLKGNDWVIRTRAEMSDYDANGYPGTIIYYEADEDDEGQMLPSVKWVVTKWTDKEPADFELFQPNFGAWELYSKTASELNDKGQIVKETHTNIGVGVEYVSTSTYEYDDHGHVIKKVNTTEYSSSEETYVNIYDADGNLQTATEFDDGREDQTSYYFWSKDGKTAIRSPKQLQNAATWFDLGGRRLNAAPTKKGLFIREGRKVIIK